MHAAIYSILAANAGVTALVSTRIYKGKAPQNAAYPCLVFGRDSLDYVDGIRQSADLRLSDYEILCVADTYHAADALAKAARDALNRYTGTIGGVFVEDIYIDDQRDEYDNTINKDIVVLPIRCEYTE